MRLEGKYALITGAGSGIGRALAVEASRRGMTVGLSGRRAAALRETTAMMDPAGQHILLPGDLTLPALRRKIRESLQQKWGRLDVLVNNAGVVCAEPFACTSDDGISAILATNVHVPAALTRDLLPLLRKAAPSRVVNIGSMFGDVAYPLFSVYSASKFALRGLSDALRRELKPTGVGVTYASPRATRTRAVEAFDSLIKPLQMNVDAPEAVAAQVWHSVERDADTAYARGMERLFVFIQRQFPTLIDRAVARQMRDVRVQDFIASFGPACRAHGPIAEGSEAKSRVRSASDRVADEDTPTEFRTAEATEEH